MQTAAESGFGFLARLASKPSFLNIETTLFPNGLISKETVELCGNTSSGKTCLLTQLMAKCLLPLANEGLGISVLFANTDHHFMVSNLYNVMHKILRNTWNKSDDEAAKISRESLENLSIVNCYDNSQFLLFLHSLDLILLNDENISLVIIDSISSFYWLERERNGPCMLDNYIKKLLRIIQKHIFRAKVSLIYTKSREIITSKELISCVSGPLVENINYRLNLYESNEKMYCAVETSSRQETIEYVITDDGFRWIE